ncbi:MAG TPA: glutaredoxin domain-containing protein [Patescibacteria group bacterium]|jgi:glutaredoxin|nr:glutaredoxin domain-containing protein [Patescibacteria group bacterium]
MADSTNNTATVTIFSTPWCAFCRTEKQWLESLGVSYETKDIEEDEGAKDELLAKLDGQFQGVPTTFIGDEVIVGFDRPKLQAALEANKLVSA